MPCSQPILLTLPAGSPPQNLAAYEQQGGYLGFSRAIADLSPDAVISAVEAAGLRGRGGAAFPVARKWRLAAAQQAQQKYVVANGGEHEPGSSKDKFLVEFYPHEVLEGMLLCGYATGADRGYLYLIEDMQGPIASARKALAELRAVDLLGDDIRGSGFCFEIEIHLAPPTYVAGEESAALDAIEGGPGKPREKPPYPGERGLHGAPTTVNNVETLAHLPFILRQGASAYRSIGTKESSGSMLFTLPESVLRPGVYELAFDRSYRDLIEGEGGGTRSGRPIRAILPALSCAFLSADHLDAPIAHESLAEFGTSPGCGGVSIIEQGQDALAEIVKIARFFMAAQCGQCPPCRMVTNQSVHILEAAVAGKAPDHDAQIRKLAAFGRGKGLCSLIQMATAPLCSALEIFAEDFAAVGRG